MEINTMLLPFAIVSIITALIMYSIGVWGEKLSGILHKKHLWFFWIGFVFDTLGTTLMGRIAGVFKFNLHGITGVAAIVLMLTHAIWATIALTLKKEKVLRDFHKFSITVWVIWLVPFFTGMFLAMVK
jgi:uncharacterized repeat protein (TIGR03987 family)